MLALKQNHGFSTIGAAVAMVLSLVTIHMAVTLNQRHGQQNAINNLASLPSSIVGELRNSLVDYSTDYIFRLSNVGDTHCKSNQQTDLSDTRFMPGPVFTPSGFQLSLWRSNANSARPASWSSAVNRCNSTSIATDMSNESGFFFCAILVYRRFKGPQNPKLEPAKTPLVARRCGTPTVYQPSNAPLA